MSPESVKIGRIKKLLLPSGQSNMPERKTTEGGSSKSQNGRWQHRQDGRRRHTGAVHCGSSISGVCHQQGFSSEKGALSSGYTASILQVQCTGGEMFIYRCKACFGAGACTTVQSACFVCGFPVLCFLPVWDHPAQVGQSLSPIPDETHTNVCSIKTCQIKGIRLSCSSELVKMQRNFPCCDSWS